MKYLLIGWLCLQTATFFAVLSANKWVDRYKYRDALDYDPTL